MALRYTEAARRAIGTAYKEASILHHTHVDTGHVLLGYIRIHGDRMEPWLRNLGLTMDDVRDQILTCMAEHPENPDYSDKLEYSSGVEDAMRFANEEAKSRASKVIDAEHLVLGLCLEGSEPAAMALAAVGINAESLRTAVYGGA